MHMPLEIKDKSQPKKTIKVEAFRKHVRRTAPHKHNSYFELVYLSQGNGIHAIDEIEYPITPPVMFCIRKDQVHFWDITEEPEGYVIIIKNDFISECGDSEIKQLIYKLSKYNYLPCVDDNLTELFRLLCTENKQEGEQRKSIVEGLTKALLSKLLQQANSSQMANNAKDHSFQQFIAILNQNKGLINSVAHYAGELNTTPQNLNAICRKEANKTASEVISEHIIAESKRLLLYSNLNVSEISDHLNFNDNSHFTKYFKRHMNITPDAYRRLDN